MQEALRNHAAKILLTLLLVLCAGSLQAKPFVADISIRSIEITSRFTGTEILLFGARNDAGDIVVVVRGPEQTYTVRKKERVAGIWMNHAHETLRSVNGFYAIASSVPLDHIRNEGLLRRLSVNQEVWNLKEDTDSNSESDVFQQAFLEYKRSESLYPEALGEVSFMGDTLFRSSIRFPEKIPRGMYTVEVYLFSDGQLMGFQSTPLEVQKSGADAWVYDLAYEHAWIYALASVLIALGAGWVASIVFKKI